MNKSILTHIIMCQIVNISVFLFKIIYIYSKYIMSNIVKYANYSIWSSIKIDYVPSPVFVVVNTHKIYFYPWNIVMTMCTVTVNVIFVKILWNMCCFFLVFEFFLLPVILQLNVNVSWSIVFMWLFFFWFFMVSAFPFILYFTLMFACQMQN